MAGRNTKAAYRQYLASDEIFRNEIRNKIGEQEFADIEAELEEEHAAEGEDAEDDDSDIPLKSIIKEVSGLDIDVLDNGTFSVDSTLVDRGDDGVLRVIGMHEDVWAYDDEGNSMAPAP